ncbi:MAG: class I SAM-dependent methyltransferase [Actinobacteria bacterium]|nr:class I SAM-dependent methyltransferase [Actinomycetota bacterium]MBU1944873.1 class I SAM-dependent methyltransferase [Actinomycetota bacterium]MBU2688077.1 class I SAM-dependent methyltransferase [Actinomycetota bacterium]
MAHPHRRCPADDPGRREWQDPEAILSGIGLSVGDVFVDLGSGEGFFSLPAARVVGEAGTVYALDIDAEAIERLRASADREGLGNVVAVAGPAEDHVLCEACADFVFFGIDLHDFRDAGKVLRNARMMVKPDGLLVDLDWKKQPMEMGPPPEMRFDEEKAAALIRSAGFEVVSSVDQGPMHYIISAQPA